ncbi:MAG: hypothetical protein WB662_05325 [Methyloceanibacter sp.]
MPSETAFRTCDKCQPPLIEIDHHRELLIGCIECNRWGREGSALFMELPEDDLQALSNLSNARHKAEDTKSGSTEQRTRNFG